jgi:2-methylcitrate dehydratase PrpD
MTSTISERLGEFVATTKYADFPADVIERTKACLLHNIGVSLAGRRAERYAHKLVASAYHSPREATLFWDGRRVSAEGAALANAALMHARTQDDYHSPSSSHPGSSLMPAAIAVAEIEQRSGKDFLTALILGYEVAGRMGRNFDKAATQRGFRPAPIYGVFGAAAASARLMNLSGRQVADAIGFAANLSAGLGQTWVEGTNEWRFHVGIAARNGLFAARIAATGATAARHSLEGSAGFFRAVSGHLDHVDGVLADLGKHWQIRDVTQKLFPLCALLQSPVQMMLGIAREHDLSPEQIEEIAVFLSPFEAKYPGIDSRGPFTDQGGTLMSAQYCLSLALLERKMTMSGLLRFDDPAIHKLMTRVHVRSDDALGLLCSRLSVRTRDGRALAAETQLTPTASKFSFEETAGLVRSMAPEMTVSAHQIEALIDAVHTLERQPDLTRLLRCFKGARGTTPKWTRALQAGPARRASRKTRKAEGFRKVGAQ